MSNFTWSKDQLAIFSAVTENLQTSFIIDACAGASKTTTIVELVNRLVTQHGVRPGTILALAFNKKIAETLSERMPDGVVCSTLNAFGHRALRNYLPANRLSVSSWKEKNIWQNIPAFDTLSRIEQQNIIQAHMAVKLHGALLANFDTELCPEPDKALEYLQIPLRALPQASTAEELFREKLDAYTTELDARDYVEYFRQAFTLDLYTSIAKGSISFQDQLFLPVVLKNISLTTFPHVLIDEAQDLGPLEHAMLEKIVSRYPKGRLIAVGDRAQAIYAFRGAHYNSLDKLAESFSASYLGLPVSFRCPAAVVREAQRYDSRIQVWDKSPEGKVEVRTHWTLDTLQRPSTILCRVNYPLIGAGLELIKSGIGAKFLARDLEGQIRDFFLAWKKKCKILPGMFLAIEAEIKRLSEDSPKKADRMLDMKECLEAIARHYSAETFDELDEGITKLFNSPGPITLATIHKAKGLEWPTVYLLRPDLIPHPNATTDEQLQQEYNMLYVAITRAQEYFAYLQ